MQVSQGIYVFFSNNALWVQNKALGGMLIVSFDLGIALGAGGKLTGSPFFSTVLCYCSETVTVSVQS